MSADETPVTEPRLINTFELLTFEDFEDCLGSLYFPFVVQLFAFALFLFCFPYLIKFPFLCFAGKMKDLGDLVNAASKNVQSLKHLIAGYGAGSTSNPVVEFYLTCRAVMSQR
jgi:hypothetical protein